MLKNCETTEIGRRLKADSNPAKVTKSEFEREYDKYGYSFPEGNFTEWTNENWNAQQARTYSENLNKRATEHRKISTFDLTLYASLGYSFDELMAKNFKDIKWEEYQSITRTFVDEYVGKQLNYG